jgi:hypothetical protein
MFNNDEQEEAKLRVIARIIFFGLVIVLAIVLVLVLVLIFFR